MGACIYCGCAAGLFRRQHEICRQRHDDTENKILDFFAKALTSLISPLRFRELTEQLARASYIRDAEYRQIILRGFSSFVDAALSDDALSESDESRFYELLNAFGLGPTEFREAVSVHRLFKASILRQLGEGKLPSLKVSISTISGDNPINLEPDEKIIWVLNDVTYSTARTQYVGVSQGVSLRVTKGVYYRFGVYAGAPDQTEYVSKSGTGYFVMTNRNVYFLSPLKVLKIPIRKIVAIVPRSDGLSISRDGVSAKPAIFTLDDPSFVANAIRRLSQIESAPKLKVR